MTDVMKWALEHGETVDPSPENYQPHECPLCHKIHTTRWDECPECLESSRK